MWCKYGNTRSVLLPAGGNILFTKDMYSRKMDIAQ